MEDLDALLAQQTALEMAAEAEGRRFDSIAKGTKDLDDYRRGMEQLGAVLPPALDSVRYAVRELADQATVAAAAVRTLASSLANAVQSQSAAAPPGGSSVPGSGGPPPLPGASSTSTQASGALPVASLDLLRAAVDKLREAYERTTVASQTAKAKQEDAAKSVGREWAKSVATVAGAYNSAWGAVQGFVTAASPAATDTLSKSFQLLAGQIGMEFIPIIARVSAWFQEAAAWVRNLDSGVKDNVARWVGLGLAFLAVGKGVQVVGGIISTFGGVASAAVRLVSLAVSGIVGAFRLAGTMAMMALNLIVSGAGAAKTAVMALYAFASAHPFIALAIAIAAVTAVVLTMSGAFSSAGEKIDGLHAKMKEMEATLAEMDSTDKVTRKQVEKLSTSDQGALLRAGGDANEQRKVWTNISQRRLLPEQRPEALAQQENAIKGALEASRGKESGVREREMRIAAGLQRQGVDAGDIASYLEKIRPTLRKNVLDDESIKDLASKFTEGSRRHAFSIELADRALRQGFVPLNREQELEAKARLKKAKDDEEERKRPGIWGRAAQAARDHIPTIAELIGKSKEMMAQFGAAIPNVAELPGLPGGKTTEAEIRARHAVAFPKEMNAGLGAIEGARKQFQIAALEQDPLQQQILRTNREGFMKLQEQMERMIQAELKQLRQEPRGWFGI